jgi:hypothetical protein
MLPYTVQRGGRMPVVGGDAVCAGSVTTEIIAFKYVMANESKMFFNLI